MCTHSNKKIKVLTGSLVFFLLMAVFSFNSQAQYYPVSVTSVVYPPFSPKLSYYLANSNKVNVTLINTSGRPLDVYIQGSFTGDNGIDVSTEPGYKPDLPITLEPNIPFRLTASNIEKVFSLDHLVFSGITKDELLQFKGFPEGTYQMCFRVYSYESNQPLSDENIGCSNPILIQYVDPPVILYPVCGDTINATPVQNVIFTWATPPTAGIIYSYRFIMVEVQPDERNPYDAFMSSGTPYFYETELNTNQLIMGPAEPQLIEGRTYAFIVQAYDINNEVLFKNNGTSEVCWFTYKSKFKISLNNDSTVRFVDAVSKEFNENLDFIPNTKISGQLKYKPATTVLDGSSYSTGNRSGDRGTVTFNTSGNTGNNNSGSSGAVNSSARVASNGKVGGTDFKSLTGNKKRIGNANTNFNGFGSFSGVNINTTAPGAGISLSPPFGSGSLNGEVFNIGNAEPLRNTTVRLVARFGFLRDDGYFDVRSLADGIVGSTIDINGYKFYDLNGNELSKEKVLSVIGRVLDVCTTDDQGNFSFDFMTDYFTGPVYAVSSGAQFGNKNYVGTVSLRLEVENQKFCSPDINIFAKPGDITSVPPQLALIKDYNLDLTVISEYDDVNKTDGTEIYNPHDTKPKAIVGGNPIPNAIVRVLRNSQKLNNEHPAVLLSEGSQSGEIVKTDYGEFKEVFKGITDADGKIVIPHLVEHWALTDGEDQSPYLFYIRTREENVDSAYNNTLYLYEPYFGSMTGLRISVDAGGPTQFDDDAGFNGTQPVTYNHTYQPPQSATNREVGLKASKPEIQGRLMAQTNLENIAIKGIKVNLYEQTCENCNSGFYNKGFAYSNKAGFFRFPGLNVDFDVIGNSFVTRGPYRRIYIESPLYKSIMWPPQNQAALNLKYGELYFKEFQLEPKQLLRGNVVDELGNPVKSYVRFLPNSPYVKTETRWEYDGNGNIYESGEVFESVALAGGRLEIQPLSNSYFADTVLVPAFKPGYLKTFTVYRKMHRLRLQLYDKESHGVIANATVIVGDTLAIGKTNGAGIAELAFPSPGEQFLVRVFAENYTPTQESYNIPVTKNWVNKTLEIHYALHITGTVTETNSGNPVDSAMVYTQLQTTDGHSLFLKTFTDANGDYRLDGIPWYVSSTDIEVHAVKSGKNPSYIGQKKVITIKNSMMTGGYNFRIQAVDGWDLSNIWGFPVTIESLKSRVGMGTRISGYFHHLPHNPDFNTVNQDEKIYFKNLKVTRGSNGKIVPEGDAVTTENYTLPVKINGGFEGRLFIMNNYQNGPYIKLKKNGDFGYMAGQLKIDLSSFKFAYDFSGDFYLGNDTTKTDITVFRSVNQGATSGFYSNKHFLFDYEKMITSFYPKPISGFRVFGFNASSTFEGSYIQNGVIHIATRLHTNIAMPLGRPALDLKIDAGEIQITKDNMDLVHNPDNQLSFELEKWKVVSTGGWTFDKTRDAIVIPKGVIYTGLGVDASIKGLNIRPDALREGELDFDKGLSLGGIATLNLASGLSPTFNYDAGVGHYRISLVGNSSGPAAWVDNLPATPDRLEFTSVGMLSDNSTVLSLGKTMRFHNLMDVFVDQVMSGEGFFRLSGMPDLGIPGYVATRAEMTYTKQNGNLKFKLEPLSGGVDCNANVVYALEQKKESQSLTNKLYTSYGTFNIKPPPGKGGEDVQIKGILTKTPTGCYIDVVTPQSIKMGKEQFDLIDGKISVTGNSWGQLNFRCHTHSEGLDDNNILAFNVHGGLEAKGDGIKADEIDTPLGSLSIAYLFPEKALVGKLTIDTKIDMGFAALNSGMLATRFDPAGFYLAFSGNVTMTQQTYLGGVILGIYNDDLSEVTADILKDFRKNPPDLTSIHGIYVIAQRDLVDETFSIPVAPPMFVLFKAGIGAYVHLDYANPTVVVGGYAFLDANGGYSVPLCGFVGVDTHAFFEVSGGYKHKELFIKACGTVSAGVEACGLKGGITVLHRAKLSNSGNNEFILQLGGSCQ